MATTLNLAGHFNSGDFFNYQSGVWKILKKGAELSCFPGGGGVFEYSVIKIKDVDRPLTWLQLEELKHEYLMQTS